MDPERRPPHLPSYVRSAQRSGNLSLGLGETVSTVLAEARLITLYIVEPFRVRQEFIYRAESVQSFSIVRPC